ncbi:MAG TPA: hypothetical protein VL326_00580 [Kofleriaceae bacterium]|nr:hypothetical protein [Kofleriaceae bacterium]
MMSWRVHAERLFTERVILLVGWLLFMVYAYPGYMSADSIWQLAQARNIEPMSDWHPPMMALIWRFLDWFIAGPVLMLVLQSVLFLVGLYALLSRVMSGRAAAITAVVLLLLPGNIIVMAVIWKDSLMAGCIASAIPALLSKKRGWRITGYVLLWVATAVRYNAMAPILPLVVVLFDWDKAWPWFKRWPAAVGIWLAITIAAIVANGLITKKQDHPWPIGAASTEVAGTIRWADDLDADALVRETPDAPWAVTTGLHAHLEHYYRPANSYKQVFEGDGRIFDYPKTDQQRDAIGALWRKVVREHFGAFLHHRWAVFNTCLDSRVTVWRLFADSEASARIVKSDATHSAIQEAWSDALIAIVKKKFFRPRLYFYLTLILICFTRRNRLAFAVLASGIAHELGLFALAPAVDYRYSHWMILTALLGAILIFVERRRMSPTKGV